jgi:hypothetical protein
MYRKELDNLVDRVLTGDFTAEQVIFEEHLDYKESIYLIKHLTSELIDRDPEALESPVI